jgi:NADP-dependent aldehyde dehydrogenase
MKCTNPGVVLALKGEAFTALQNAATTALNASPAQKMLTDGIQSAFHSGLSRLSEDATEVTDGHRADAPRHGRAPHGRPTASPPATAGQHRPDVSKNTVGPTF